VNDIGGASDTVPTPHRIKEHVLGKRYRQKKQEELNNGYIEARNAHDSFKGVPGRNRGEQVAYICGQRSAEKWANGERDNEGLNAMLANAHAYGFVFDGVDYDQIDLTKRGTVFGMEG
jgi:hypothetical protein